LLCLSKWLLTCRRVLSKRTVLHAERLFFMLKDCSSCWKTVLHVFSILKDCWKTVLHAESGLKALSFSASVSIAERCPRSRVFKPFSFCKLLKASWKLLKTCWKAAEKLSILPIPFSTFKHAERCWKAKPIKHPSAFFSIFSALLSCWKQAESCWKQAESMLKTCWKHAESCWKMLKDAESMLKDAESCWKHAEKDAENLHKNPTPGPFF